ncbi:uncharacterized protein LOC117240070 [Bombus vosnesenskii]|uniref:Uncharacterized protein LOC117240070 n=1 Tax=Bombus vosnesenskii TaxID=207650 RepID=A0A6J3L866_9HYME|nr:uncharacterized protein LOC117240070 [Bombus vosnesenskii]
MRILQTNLGRSRRAQDLSTKPFGSALAVVAEPYRVLDAPEWVGDTDEMVAVTWTSTSGAFAHGALLERGNGYVPVEWAGMVVVGVYVSPNSGWAAFEEFLDGVGDCVKRRLQELHRRHHMGLPRCIQADFRLESSRGVKTLSDHLYIFMEVDTPGPGTATAGDGRGPLPRWKVEEMNGDLLRAIAIATAWSWEASTTTTETDVEEEAENLRRAMTAICDASMPRATPGSVRSRAVY